MALSDNEFVLTACGDLMFYGPVADRMARSGDPLWSLRPLGDALLQGDLLFGNLETPISIARQPAKGAPDRFFSPPGAARALRGYGFGIVNLAHNHILDFGAEGVEATISEADSVGLPYIGVGRSAEEASRPAIIQGRGGVRIGFLGYTTANNSLESDYGYVACRPELSRVTAQVKSLRVQVDYVVVSCHTGAQYNPYPAPEARAIAHAAINAGASIYLGHHPHVPQGCERIGDGLAVYSLGDFVAPPDYDYTRRTFFVRARLADGAVRGYECVPCYIDDECRTTLPDEGLRGEIAARINELSVAITEGRSDALHFATAGGRFSSQYLSSWREEFSREGIGFFWRKLRNLRLYHLRLVWHALFGRHRRARGE